MAWPNHMIFPVLIKLNALYCIADKFKAKKGQKRPFFSEILTFINWLYLGDRLSDPFEIWHAH